LRDDHSIILLSFTALVILILLIVTMISIVSEHFLSMIISFSFLILFIMTKMILNNSEIIDDMLTDD